MVPGVGEEHEGTREVRLLICDNFSYWMAQTHLDVFQFFFILSVLKRFVWNFTQCPIAPEYIEDFKLIGWVIITLGWLSLYKVLKILGPICKKNEKTEALSLGLCEEHQIHYT